jgi:outer membrane protein OmpA-like peptidoglycan-associated protein
MKTFHGLIVAFSLSVILVPFCIAQECKDSPLITRFPGSTFRGCDDSADRIVSLPTGPGKPVRKVEGEYHYVYYRGPDTTSADQLIRNLTTALKAAGFIQEYNNGSNDVVFHQGKTWIREQVSGVNYEQTVVIETALTQEVVATAAALAGGLTSNGHMVVNGILFDTGKADVKPESASALQEVVKLLQQDAKLKLYVVGHTDNVGVLAANLELSRQRAAAVVHELTTKYAVTADRLQPFGDGPYAPVTSNDSADGRTLNRRVEIVKQ